MDEKKKISKSVCRHSASQIANPGAITVGMVLLWHRFNEQDDAYSVTKVLVISNVRKHPLSQSMGFEAIVSHPGTQSYSSKFITLAECGLDDSNKDVPDYLVDTFMISEHVNDAISEFLKFKV